MSSILAELFSKISPDPFRQQNSFSPEIEAANTLLEQAAADENKIIKILREWIFEHQPCLFGRLAAKLDMLSFCILTEKNILDGDEVTQKKIQMARTAWTREGYKGNKSGFILFVLSEKLANSLPDEPLKEFAKELCSKYLLQQVEEDTIYTDEIFYEKPGTDQMTWKWFAGVNYFCANADKRWWQDHRIPGGLAFSVNSVGHMAKSGSVGKIMNELNKMLGEQEEKYTVSKIDSLEQGLKFAMKTIDLASDSVSGKATTLIPIGDGHKGCPFSLTKDLEGKDCRTYQGYYHTDITIPSEYFVDAIERPADCEIHHLDFTYLYDRDIKNPDYITMGDGRRIRAGNNNTGYSSNPKPAKVFLEEVSIDDSARLKVAIID